MGATCEVLWKVAGRSSRPTADGFPVGGNRQLNVRIQIVGDPDRLPIGIRLQPDLRQLRLDAGFRGSPRRGVGKNLGEVPGVFRLDLRAVAILFGQQHNPASL